MVDFVGDFSARTGLAATRVSGWIGIAPGKFFDWRQRYEKANEHNALVPRDHRVEKAERQAIVDHLGRHPLEGYRRLTFRMLDDDIDGIGPAPMYRVRARSGRLARWARTPSRKGRASCSPMARDSA